MRKAAHTTWIVGATLLTQDDERRVLRADLRLEDGRITEISRGKRKPSKSDQVIQAAGLILMPGLVQIHLHLCQTLFRNMAEDLELLDWLSEKIWPMESVLTERLLRSSVRAGLYELLRSGTTCILDMGTVRHTDVIFEEATRSGIRANIGKCLMDDPRSYPGLHESTGEAMKEALGLFTRWNSTSEDRIRASFAPRFAYSCTESLLSQVAQESARHGAMIHIHACENKTENAEIERRSGLGQIEYLHRLGLTGPRTVFAHCVWPKPSEVALLRETRSHIAHCPGSNLKLASGVAPIPEFLKKGINVGLGADGAACNNHLDLFSEMRLASLVQKPLHGVGVLKAQEILDLATRNGAKALGWEGAIGSLEVGKRADIIALDLDAPECALPGLDRLAETLVYSARAENVLWTMVDGKIVCRGGRPRFATQEKIRSELKEARGVLSRSLRNS